MSSSNALEKAEALVKDLIDFKENYPLKEDDSCDAKDEQLEQRLKSVLIELDQLQLSIENKAAFFYLRGKSLNSISANYDVKALECLSKAVKLDPNHIDAWNELGECYWKNKSIDEAANCFNSALSKNENKVSLRNLSMVQRQQGSDFDSKVENIKLSVETAKKAIKMDVTDGKSWFVLGNSLLSLFFFAGQSPVALKQCMAAYSKAEQDDKQQKNPDLYYNRAVAYKYQEEFNEALHGFKKAAQLDKKWNLPRDETVDVIKRLQLSADMLKNKGHLKQKKLATLVNQIKDSEMGPFSSGTYVSPLNKTISLQKVFIGDLKSRRNDNAVIHGKVVAVIPVTDAVPFPFILMDSQRDCIAVSVFNLAIGKGMIVGDSVAIPEPYVEDVSVNIGDEKIEDRSIRVDNPVVLVVNKRKVGPDRLAFSVLAVTNQSE